ncbi:MAG: hypothetical protein J2P40_14865, partial [Candidatus Dormibacteraeota bacterium]|nr:hypothetical protein [Candidatus Dormibacteraeota bacterium]MBO0762554.1 hypothetical protein [Candidatus Dormibacteraeota bacterium]
GLPMSETCIHCGAHITDRSRMGRPRQYCSDVCRWRVRRRRRQDVPPDLPAADTRRQGRRSLRNTWREQTRITSTPRTDADGNPIWSARVRPFAIPDDLEQLRAPTVSGRVTLPRHLWWSGPSPLYDLTQRRDRARVYEIVLQEGTMEDLRRYIGLEDLIDLWPDMVLPPHVRAAWSRKIRQQLGVDLEC